VRGFSRQATHVSGRLVPAHRRRRRFSDRWQRSPDLDHSLCRSPRRPEFDTW